MERKPSDIVFIMWVFFSYEEQALGRKGLLAPVSTNVHQYCQALYSKARNFEEVGEPTRGDGSSCKKCEHP